MKPTIESAARTFIELIAVIAVVVGLAIALTILTGCQSAEDLPPQDAPPSVERPTPGANAATSTAPKPRVVVLPPRSFRTNQWAADPERATPWDPGNPTNALPAPGEGGRRSIERPSRVD